MKTLFVDPRGCDFWENEEYISDVGNYRLVACVMASNGEPLIMEFGGYDRKGNKNILYANGYHEVYTERPGELYDSHCGCYGFNFEKALGISPEDYHYTRSDILRFVSDVTGEEYTSFVFGREAVDKEIERMYTPLQKANADKCLAGRKAATSRNLKEAEK